MKGMVTNWVGGDPRARYLECLILDSKLIDKNNSYSDLAEVGIILCA